VEAHPKISKAGWKDGCLRKACMILGYVHNTTKAWNIWDPDLSKAVNCLDLYFDERQTYISCIAGNKSSSDPLGLLEEEPVVTEVMEDSPKAENPDTAPEQKSNLVTVLDTPAVTPSMRLGVLEEAPIADSQSEPNRVIAAIPLSPAG